MNPIDQNIPTSDDQRFDLLVDGELNEAARRELLSGLDDEPAGWRRCALAFLEAQTWRQECGAIGGEARAELPPHRRAAWFRLGGPAGTLMAMAASFLVALVLGGLVQGIWSSGAPAGGPPIDGQFVLEGPKAPLPSEKSPEGLQGAPPEQRATGPGEVRWVEFSGPEGEGQTIRLPAMERDQLGENWPDSLPTPMSPELLEHLQKAGLRVEQRRRLLPWRMKDGRRLVVPVDEVDVHYVGNPTL